MPNHVHISAVPQDEDGLWRTFRYVHRHYTGYIKSAGAGHRASLPGSVQLGCGGRCACDDGAALRRAQPGPRQVGEAGRGLALVERAGAPCRPGDPNAAFAPVRERVGDFAAFIGEDIDEASDYAALRKAETIGRPIGAPEWLEAMEKRTGLPLRPRKRCPKPKMVEA